MVTHKNSSLVQSIAHKDLAIASEAITVSPVTFSECVRAVLQNWRQGTVACKDRSKVTSRSNKKPWKQKGTGRARAGSPRSPLWRGGGVVFGPQERVRTLKVSKSMRTNVLQSLLHNKLAEAKVLALDWTIAENKPKTALAAQLLTQAELHNKKIVLFVSVHDYQIQASFANIQNVRLISFDEPNVYDLASDGYWVFLKKDIDQFKEMVNTWI